MKKFFGILILLGSMTVILDGIFGLHVVTNTLTKISEILTAATKKILTFEVTIIKAIKNVVDKRVNMYTHDNVSTSDDPDDERGDEI